MPQSREVLDAVIISKLAIAMTAAAAGGGGRRTTHLGVSSRRRIADRAYVRGIAVFVQDLNHRVAA